ncbi:methylamine utilization protein [Paucibacter sp. O1-1]|nr:methylamine utilization protein [Paucibacter sp. O1-1]MDA3825797.1 methylamine utilization protein [Paucibacter sp. O1-1]
MKSPRVLPSALLLTALIAGPALALPWTVLVRSTAGEPLADAVVAVELRAQTSRAAPGAKAEMAQRERQFQPHVLVVQTGTAVNFPNFDTVRHHVYSFSPVKTFDIKLYSGTPVEPVLFDKPGIATLGCNIHDKMSAHIVVVDTPLFAKTDAQGLLKLDLPAGEHNLKVWHPRVGRPVLLGQRISVAAPGGQSQVSLSLE